MIASDPNDQSKILFSGAGFRQVMVYIFHLGRSFLRLLLAAESSPAASAKRPAVVDVDMCPLIHHVLTDVLVLKNVINEIIIDNIVLLFSLCFAYRNWLNFLGISCSRFS